MLNPMDNYQGINIASVNDVVAMKLVAISDRNTKKDFIDLYQGISMEKNKFTLIKSMTYFEEADSDIMPDMLNKVSWDEVCKCDFILD